MKNNFITKIIGATLAFAMMIGGAVGINAVKEAKEVNADAASMAAGNSKSVEINVSFNGGEAVGGVRVGTKSDNGSATFTIPAFANSVSFYAAGWKGTAASISVAVSVGTITPATWSLTANDAATGTINAGDTVSISGSENDYFKTFTTAGVSTSATVTISSSGSNRRSIVWGASYTVGSAQVEDSVSVSLDPTSLNLDLYNSATGSLTATVITTGDATNGLIAESSDESVATISTASPESGNAFIVTGHSVGTANIIVTSAWDHTTSATCEVSVADSTPTFIDMKKVNALQAGQHVLIVTVVDDSNYYYLPSTTLTSGNPAAVSCTYDSVSQKLTHIDDSMLFTVGGENNAWTFSNSQDEQLYITNSNTGIRVSDTEDTFTVSQTNYGFSVKDNNNNRYLGKYKDGEHWRSYNSATADNFKGENGISSGQCISFWVEAKLDQTITGATSAYTDETVTLTSNAASPTWSIVAGDTTAEGAQVTAAGVVSVSGAGTVKVKAAHADYEDAFHTITFSVRPSESYINVEQESVSGFTGLHETLEFDFGNIDNPATAINVVSNNTSIVTVNAPSIGATTGSVQINFVGAGTTTVKFNEGEEEKDSVTVTVTQSSVSITGMPATSSVFVGNTINLGSQVTVTATGSNSNAVTWESDNENVATVTDAGVVTGVAQGTANITVTSVSDDNVSATCAVTVSRVLFTNTDSIQNGKRYVLATSNNYYLPAATQTVAENPAASHFNSSNELTKADAWYASVDANNHIVFSNTVGNDTFYLNGKDASRGISVGSTASGYWTLDNDGYLYHSSSNTRFLALFSSTDFRYYAKSQSGAVFVTTYYEYIPTAKEEVEELKTSTSLSYTNYHAGENDTFTYDDLAIRFGGKITPALWNKLDTESHIEGFGVLLAVGDLDGDSIETWYNAYKTESNTVQQAIDELETDGMVEEYYKTKQQKAHPTQVGDVYSWNLYEEIEDSTASILEERTAVAYIRIENDIVFLKQDTVSAKSLAFDLIDSGAYEDNAFGGSLHYMAYLNN